MQGTLVVVTVCCDMGKYIFVIVDATCVFGCGLWFYRYACGCVVSGVFECNAVVTVCW